MKIGIIVGSLRKGSFNRKLAEISKNIINEGNEAEIIDISYLPFYNKDDDGVNPREEYVKIREELKKYDAYLFFTPEYNHSLAPSLKNVIDIGSRDQGQPLGRQGRRSIFCINGLIRRGHG